MKSERHHWWPEGVSEFWKDSEGCTSWLLPTGEVKRMPPKNLGVIGNGHHVKLNKESVEETVWDFSFEAIFQGADSNFPNIINWLLSLDYKKEKNAKFKNRFKSQIATEEQLKNLVECLVSIAVRSPVNREASVSWAEDIRGPLPARERNALIGLNLKDTQQTTIREIGTRGKFVILFSPDREFIFGDGFYHTIRSPYGAGISPKIFAPLTPDMAVLFVSPSSYTIEPRIMSFVATAEETALFNIAIQAYARNAIFYRNEKPVILDCFAQAKHLEFNGNNPIDRFIDTIPGIPSRDWKTESWFNQLATSSP